MLFSKEYRIKRVVFSVFTRLFVLSYLFVTPQVQAQTTPDDSGMWLLPQIKGAVHAEMRSKGLELPSEAFYDSLKPALNDAIVRVNIGQGGGGTGSFISAKGLILTNHHVAYDAIASASTAEKNYLKNGFFAESLSNEVPAKDYYLYIPVAQIEVTQQLLALKATSDTLSEQTLRDSIVAQIQKKYPDHVVELDDYFSGNAQYVAVYKVINDVRLVFAPPSSIGKFGGDVDNWMWPRHTGDFSFLRAYVAADGSSAPFDSTNVPYVPDTYLKVDTSGVNSGDFLMTLGFPGSTYRFESSYAFNFYQHHRNDYIIKSYRALLTGMEYEAKLDPDKDVATASDRASIANTLKYFEGIQQGFKQYNVVEKRQKEEQLFQEWLAQDSLVENEYGMAIPTLKKAYDIANLTGDKVYSGIYTLRNNAILDDANLLEPFYSFLRSDSVKSFSKSQRNELLKQIKSFSKSFEENEQAQWITLKGHLVMLLEMPDSLAHDGVKSLLNPSGLKGNVDEVADGFINKIKTESLLFNPQKAEKVFKMKKKKALQLEKDPIYELKTLLETSLASARPVFGSHFALADAAMKTYVKGFMEFSGDSTIYPDANFTLRLSGGRVTGYSPADGIYYTPKTTLEGVLAKDTGIEPFDVPTELKAYVAQQSKNNEPVSAYANENGKLIVNFLSTNDITGGNSGSPVLSSKGHVVGVAFDGNIEGVFGDYFFDTELKRMISCDIRYILFVTEELYHQKRLVEEMEFAGSIPVKP